jgi:ABC-2 type transport system ATP-binding protein
MSEVLPLIQVKGITKSFGSNIVLQNCDLNIDESEILLLLGKSGCGKSTFLKVLLGLYKPERGEIIYKGKHLRNNIDSIRKKIGYVSQENSFYEKLSVIENMYFYSKLYGIPDNVARSKVIDLLNLVRLFPYANTLAEKISGGMKRRLEFAISLINNPEILILDEPFAGLDPAIRAELLNLIKTIKNSGVTIIISTHQINVFSKIATRVTILNKKRIVDNIKMNFEIDLEKYFLMMVEK